METLLIFLLEKRGSFAKEHLGAMFNWNRQSVPS
jgi:hypothetical protein